MSKEHVPKDPPFRTFQRNLRCYIADVGLPYDKLPILRPNLTVEWKKVDLVDLMVDEDNPVTCPICLDESLFMPRVTRCGHAFCWICILKYINFQNNSKGLAKSLSSHTANRKPCPLCMQSLYKEDLKPVRFQIKRKPTVLTFALLTQEEGAETAVLHPKICEMICGAPRMREDMTIASSNCLDIQFWDVAFTDHMKLRDLLKNDYLTLEGIALNASEDDTATHEAVAEALQVLQDLGVSMPNDNPFPSANDVDNIEESIHQLRVTAESYVYGEEAQKEPTSETEGRKKTYCFYQSIDGCKVLLHPILLKCLWKCCDQSIGRMPLFLVNLPVLGLEEIVVTANMRKRYNWLNHFRMGSKLYLAHVPLDGYVSQSEFDNFMRKRQIAMDMKYSKILQSQEESQVL